jgi:uncharacterized protein with HEPN domain
MPEPIIIERLEIILDHCTIILDRLEGIKDASDFINSEQGQIIYDSLLIRLQSIGENIKKIARMDPAFVENNLSIDVDKIIRFRDIVSHHYELLDYQVIYNICTVNIPELSVQIDTFLRKEI